MEQTYQVTAEQPEYNKLTFCNLTVADVEDLLHLLHKGGQPFSLHLTPMPDPPDTEQEW